MYHFNVSRQETLINLLAPFISLTQVSVTPDNFRKLQKAFALLCLKSVIINILWATVLTACQYLIVPYISHACLWSFNMLDMKNILISWGKSAKQCFSQRCGLLSSWQAAVLLWTTCQLFLTVPWLLCCQVTLTWRNCPWHGQKAISSPDTYR